MRWIALLGWFLTAAAHAAPATDTVAEVLSGVVAQANAGDRKGAVRALDALLKQQPDLVDAHVLRGINRHLLGDAAGAREDLAWAFSSEQLATISSDLSEQMVLTTTTNRVDLSDQRIVGAATLAVIEARVGDGSAALGVVTRARAVFGDDARLKAAEARALLATGAFAPAWAALAVARAAPDPTGFTASVTSEMAALDPERAPAEIFETLGASGQWSAFYNRARGALAQKQYPACVAAIREGLAAFDEPQLVAVGYTCAARSDVAEADRWLAVLGGPTKADPADVFAHATTLVGQAKHEAAVALLSQLPKKLPAEQARTRQTLWLEALLTLGKLDDAVAISDGTTAPASETRLAHALITAKRTKEALTILEKACPALGTDPARAGCDKLLAWAEQQ